MGKRMGSRLIESRVRHTTIYYTVIAVPVRLAPAMIRSGLSYTRHPVSLFASDPFHAQQSVQASPMC
jgi:hypothetical protein